MKKEAYFAAGCFWGVEYFFKKQKGVVKTTVGYCGGFLKNPSYEQVKTGSTGHLETVKIIFDDKKVTFDDLVKLFFEIHDFTQTDGQGPDVGNQYLSAIFYKDYNQKEVANKYIRILKNKGYLVATQLLPLSEFWQAEDYHQNYYDKTGGYPYCHFRRKIFDSNSADF